MKQSIHFFRRTAALFLALALCLSLSAPALAAEETAAPETAPQTLDKFAEETAEIALTYGGAVSATWAVWQDGSIISSGRTSSLPADATHLQQLADASSGTIYGIGSISKIYTTVAVMQLVEAGKVDLDKPVTAYLPTFKMADERYQDITVRMLLNHSSGLMGSTLSSGMLFDDPSSYATDHLLENLAGQRLKADPGAYSVYCNDGFTLAELVVEAVSGQDFMDYVRANILKPLGLKSTFAPADREKEPVAFDPAPIFYTVGETTHTLPMDCLGILGAGGVYASAEDLAAFGGALTGTTLLKQASLDAMAAEEYAKGIWPEDTLDALAFGLGWDNVNWFPFSQNGIQALVKGGDSQYYHAGLVIIPEYKLAAAVLTSGGVSTYNEMAASQMLIKVLEKEGVAVDQTAPVLPEAAPAAMPKELLDYAGYYGSMMPYKVDITADGTLTMGYLTRSDIPAQTFTYHDDGTFRDASGASYLKFVEETNGQVYLYQKAFTDLPGLGGLGTSNYAAVKLPENQISDELQAFWDTFMAETNLLPMNERYSSQTYLSISMTGNASEMKLESIPGYSLGYRIEDENHIRYAIQIPGNMGRDGADLEIRRDEKDNVWVYQSNGMIFMDGRAAPDLSTGKDNQTVTTIQPDGYARWYHVGEKAAGKTVTVQVPENAGFWVYDENGMVTASSVLWPNNLTAELTEGGLIVFAGDPGAKFQLTFA